ncbi:hypothetical protein TNCV_1794151 [Trichonephila clavipes]|nr:hypothetical protein TNCV_1794151 [Trichonephila clavipes]
MKKFCSSQSVIKSDLTDVIKGMAVGTRRAGVSVSRTANLVGVSGTTVACVMTVYARESCIYETNQQELHAAYVLDIGAILKLLVLSWNAMNRLQSDEIP